MRECPPADVRAEFLAALDDEAEERTQELVDAFEGREDEETVEEEPAKHAKTADTPHKFSTLQFSLPYDLHNAILSCAAHIPDEELAAEGRTKEPHLTLLYGLHSDEPEGVIGLLEEQQPLTVILGRVGTFKGAGDDGGDVVYVSVQGQDLHALHDRIATLPHTSTHPAYVPHIALAYVKAGLGEKYAGSEDFALIPVALSRLVFSNREGKRWPIRLGTVTVDAQVEEPARHAKDAAGHEHAPAGIPEGGQFVADDIDREAVSKPKKPRGKASQQSAHPLDGKDRSEQLKALADLGSQTSASVKASNEYAAKAAKVPTPNEPTVAEAALKLVRSADPYSSPTVADVTKAMEAASPGLTRSQAQAALYRLAASQQIRLAPWTQPMGTFPGDPRDIMPHSGDLMYYVRPGRV
jgi:2'-5' RNA ligase